MPFRPVRVFSKDPINYSSEHSSGQDTTSPTLRAAGVQSTDLRTGSVQLRRSKTGSIKVLQKDVASSREHLVIIQKECLRSILVQRRVERNSCFFLPFSVLFFLLYTAMVTQHEDTFITFETEDALRDFVNSASCAAGDEVSLESVSSPQDVWHWMKTSVVCEGSQWFRQQDVAGRPLKRSEWGRVLGADRLFGGLLLEQLRTEKASCNIQLPFSWDCYPPDKKTSDPFGSWGSNTTFLDAQVAPSMAESGLYFDREGFVTLFPAESSGDRRLEEKTSAAKALSWGTQWEKKREKWERFSFFFLEWEPLSKLKQRLQYLEDGGWLDSQTEQVIVKALLVNAEVKLLTRLTLLFDFVKTGGIKVSLRLQTSPLLAYRHSLDPLVDVSWILLLVFIIGMMIRDFRIQTKQKQMKMYFMDPWNWLDIFTVSLGIIIVLGFVVQRDAVDALTARMEQVDTEAEVTQAYLQDLRNMHHLTDWTFKGTMWYRLLLGDFVLLVMFRFFKAFRAQPRLALVTTTIYAAGADLFHFSVVLMAIFCSFAFASMVLFGRRMQQFSTFLRAAATCFAIICGDFDGAWEEVAAEHPTTALLWFWSFIILIFFVMLNMVLAIVLDVYTEARTNAINSDPLWVQAAKIFGIVRSGGAKALVNLVRLERECLSQIDSLDEEITERDIYNIIPDISPDHVRDIMIQCERLEARQQARGYALSDALTMVGVMHTDVKKMQFDMDRYFKNSIAKKSTQDQLVPALITDDGGPSQRGRSDSDPCVSQRSGLVCTAGSQAGSKSSTGEVEGRIPSFDPLVASSIAASVLEGLLTAVRSGELREVASASSTRLEETVRTKAGSTGSTGSTCDHLQDTNETTTPKITASNSDPSSPGRRDLALGKPSSASEVEKIRKELSQTVREAVAESLPQVVREAVAQSSPQTVNISHAGSPETVNISHAVRQAVADALPEALKMTETTKQDLITRQTTAVQGAVAYEMQIQAKSMHQDIKDIHKSIIQLYNLFIHPSDSRVDEGAEQSNDAEAPITENSGAKASSTNEPASTGGDPAQMSHSTDEPASTNDALAESENRLATEQPLGSSTHDATTPEEPPLIPQPFIDVASSKEVPFPTKEQLFRGQQSGCSTDAASVEAHTLPTSVTEQFLRGETSSCSTDAALVKAQPVPVPAGSQPSTAPFAWLRGNEHAQYAQNPSATQDNTVFATEQLLRGEESNCRRDDASAPELTCPDQVQREAGSHDANDSSWAHIVQGPAEFQSGSTVHPGARDAGYTDQPMQLVSATTFLRKGMRVRIVGLQTRADLNGEEGILGEYDHTQDRWQVRMDSGSGMLLKAMHLKPCDSVEPGIDSQTQRLKDSNADLRPGVGVRLRGLEAFPELNGQEGVLAEFDALNDRCKVRMSDGSGKIMRAANLEMLPSTWESLGSTATANYHLPGSVVGAPEATVGLPSSSAGETSRLAPGTRVRLTGLQTRPELNGQEGYVVEYDAPQDRWRIRMDDGSGKIFKASNLRSIEQESSPRTFLAPGDRVRLVGLQTAPHLNGQEGTLAEYDPTQTRWKVLMDDSSGKLMRPENLEVLMRRSDRHARTEMLC